MLSFDAALVKTGHVARKKSRSSFCCFPLDHAVALLVQVQAPGDRNAKSMTR